MQKIAYILGTGPDAQELIEILARNASGQWTGKIISAPEQLNTQKPAILFVDWEHFYDCNDMEVIASSVPVVGYARMLTPTQSQAALTMRIYGMLACPFHADAVYAAIQAHRGKDDQSVSLNDTDANIVEKLRRILPNDSLYRMSVFPNVQAAAILERWALMGTEYSIEHFCHCILELKVDAVLIRKSARARYFFEIRKIIKAVLNTCHCGLSFNGADESSHCILFCVPKGQILSRELVCFALKQIVEHVDRQLNCSVNIGLSRIHSRIEEMPESYNEAQMALGLQVGSRGSDPVFFDDISIPIQFPSNWHRQLNKLDQLLVRERYSEARRQLHCMLAGSGQQEASEPIPANYVLDIVSIVKINAMHQSCEDNGVLAKVLGQDIKREMLESLLNQWIDDLECQAAARNQTAQMSIVEKAKRIISLNYGMDLSLDKVAAQLYVNPCYLSRVFHKETGQKFIDYLVDIRIEKAKELLSSPELRIYQVGSCVGYPNKRYFSELFQRKCGITPSEYRKWIAKACQ